MAGPSACPILELQQVTRRYFLKRRTPFEPRPVRKVLDGLDFTVRRGESGAGKTTLTRLLTGMERPAGGTVRFRGIDLWSGGSKRRQ